MSANEATARLKINKLLEESGWRLLDTAAGRANVRVEATAKGIDGKTEPGLFGDLGDDFEHVPSGKIDYLLQDDRGFPIAVLEAKRESLEPLEGKEQARKYARSQNCRFVILSNGNLHYFWDIDGGNPYVITSFPTVQSMNERRKYQPNRQRLIDQPVDRDWIALTQLPDYARRPEYQNEAERDGFIEKNKLRFLRDYQLKAVHALQGAARAGRDRFLFVMATGTGKTLISAAVIKLFLSTNNASRVLFLVDRLELEDQAQRAFTDYLKNDATSVVYKENRDDWQKAEIVVTTVQSLLIGNKYRQRFCPTDFDLVISDEAHRSIGGNARAVFEYFVGYKLGLTATPKDYLKNFVNAPGDLNGERERRLYLDTYRTFGCDDGMPTYSYGLEQGAEEGHLIRPTVIDARTDVTTRLLAEQGLSVTFTDESGIEQTQTFDQDQFERKFFSQKTNAILCKTLIEHGMLDPVTGEFGKTIAFAVSQRHAAKLTNMLNQLAHQRWPGKYESDFAVQVTSNVPDAQQYAKNFANNSLMGSGNFDAEYKTSKARVCVTVGMMTTGYDCPDILNLALMRPIFSPTDFVQIKGRGTRKHSFKGEARTEQLRQTIGEQKKEKFLLFDFFGNCEYFEKEFNYDEVIKLPAGGSDGSGDGGTITPPPTGDGSYHYANEDFVVSVAQTEYPGGMKVDGMFFKRFEDTLRQDPKLTAAVEQGDWDQVLDYVNREFLNQPQEYYTLEKLRRATGVDRRVSLREILEFVFKRIPKLKTKDEMLEEAFAAFVAQSEPLEAAALPAVRQYFKAYVSNDRLRNIIDERDYGQLHTQAGFGFAEFKAVPETFRAAVPEYVKDYVPLNQFL